MKFLNIAILIICMLLIIGCGSVQMKPEQIEQIRSAAAKVLPSEAQVEVSTESVSFAQPALVISAHLLEGHSADEMSPYVRGNYGTREKLTRLVRYRCTKILKSILAEAEIPNVSKIKIETRHGVRQSYYGSPSGSGTDIAMTIYVVSIPVHVTKSRDWSEATVEELLEKVRVEKNIIPLLTFQTAPF